MIYRCAQWSAKAESQAVKEICREQIVLSGFQVLSGDDSAACTCYAA